MKIASHIFILKKKEKNFTFKYFKIAKKEKSFEYCM